jgi:hypothetical protein
MYDKDASEQTGDQWYTEGRVTLVLIAIGLVLLAIFA